MEGLRQFYFDHKDKLFNYLMRMTGDYDLAKDIMQESFTRILEHYSRKPKSVSLLYKIARNTLLDSLRKKRRECQTDLNEEDEYQTGNQEQAFLIREDYQRVLSAMRRIDHSERDLLSLVISGDFSYKEIASLTGMSEANIKVKVHRIRMKLKDILNHGEL